jgi:sugar phosphate isomerase/epimerase
MEPTLGVQMFTLRKYTQSEDDLKMALERVSRMGYRSIQISAFGDVKPAAVAAICADNGLAIGGTHVAWDRYRHNLDQVIEEHQLWQCRHTAVGMIPPKTYLSMAGLAKFIDEVQPISDKLKAAGIDFSYHNHAHEFRQFDGKPWLQHLYDGCSAETLKAELDTHWIQAGGADPAVWVERYGDRMPLLHLKDFAINDEYQRVFAPVGHGNMNWTTILAAARQHPIEYYFVEQDNCYGADEFDCLQQSYDYLHQQHGLN